MYPADRVVYLLLQLDILVLNPSIQLDRFFPYAGGVTVCEVCNPIVILECLLDRSIFSTGVPKEIWESRL